jgi:putative ABC transport system permease protein
VLTRELARGQPISESDVVTARRVAVLGATTAEELFPGQDPIGRNVTIGASGSG